MKKRIWTYGVFFVLLLAVLAGGTYYFVQKNKTPHLTYMANWTDRQNDFEEAYANATQVIYAKVTNLDSYMFKDFPFTDAEVEVLDVLKGELHAGDTCKILFSGGEIDGVIHEIPPQIIPSVSDVCLFVLDDYTFRHETVPGKFVPMGGYQGVLKLEQSPAQRLFGAESTEDSVHVVRFNKDNILETELKGKSLEDIKTVYAAE